jgi:hypothetical protein
MSAVTEAQNVTGVLGTRPRLFLRSRRAIVDAVHCRYLQMQCGRGNTWSNDWHSSRPQKAND